MHGRGIAINEAVNEVALMPHPHMVKPHPAMYGGAPYPAGHPMAGHPVPYNMAFHGPPG